MDKENRIKELMELRRFLIFDLENINLLEDKAGPCEHIDQMADKFLDQLNDIDNELKSLI